MRCDELLQGPVPSNSVSSLPVVFVSFILVKLSCSTGKLFILKGDVIDTQLHAFSLLVVVLLYWMHYFQGITQV